MINYENQNHKDIEEKAWTLCAEITERLCKEECCEWKRICPKKSLWDALEIDHIGGK